MSARRRYSFTLLIAFWFVVLSMVGLGHRWWNKLKAEPAAPVALEQPLATLPMRMGAWQGHEIPVDPRVMQVAGTDDHVTRRYVHEHSRDLVDVFFAYTSRPINMVGHHPEKCYPSNGWRAEGSKQITVSRSDGKPLQCNIHYFSREDVVTEGRVVLNYFVLQGKHTTQWTDFWGPKWRQPNLSRDPNYYVAQLQVVGAVPSSAEYDRAEESVTRFAAISAPYVDSILPLTNKPLEKSGTSAAGSKPVHDDSE